MPLTTYPSTQRRQPSAGYARMMTALQAPQQAPAPAPVAPATPPPVDPQELMKQRFAAAHPFAPGGDVVPLADDPAAVNGPRITIGRRAVPAAMSGFRGFRSPGEVPGVFESVPVAPENRGGTPGMVGPTGGEEYDTSQAPAAMQSRYTLRQTTPIGGAPSPADPGADANTRALALLTGGAAYNGAGASSDSPGAVLSPVEQAALGLDQQRQGFQTADALKMMQRNGAIINPDDAPEIRANKLGYYKKLLDRGAAGAPVDQITAGAKKKVTDAIQPVAKSTPGGPEYSADGRFYRSSPKDEWHPASEKKNDEKALTAQELQQVAAIQQSGRDLDSLEQAFKDLNDPSFGGPVAGRLQALDPTNPKISRLQGLVTAATPNLARGVFREVGVLTDEDIRRYQKLLPTYTDTPAQRAQKFTDLRARLARSSKEQLDTLSAAGRDVGDLQKKLGGSTPAAAGTYKDTDGRTYPIKELPGRGRGIIKGGKFYPVLN